MTIKTGTIAKPNKAKTDLLHMMVEFETNL